MADKKRVLITGSAGKIAEVLAGALGDTYEFSGIDIQPTDVISTLVADMSDFDAVHRAFQGQDVVLDLAAVTDDEAPWEPVHGISIPATYNALEAARRAGVKRFIFASSNHATGMYETDQPYSDIVAGRYEGIDPDNIPYVTADMPVRPDGPYGIAKVFGEAAGRYYSDRYGMSVLCLRIGTLNREGRPVVVRQFSTLLTHGDLIHLVERCIEAPDDVKYGIFYGVSDNKWRFYDIDNARELIGYRPQGDAETWR